MTNLSKWLESQENLAKFWNHWELSKEQKRDDWQPSLYVKEAEVYAGYVESEGSRWYENPQYSSLDDLFLLLNMKCPGWDISHCGTTDKYYLVCGEIVEHCGSTVREAVIRALKGDLE